MNGKLLNKTEPARVLLVDDHALVRAQLTSLIDAQTNLTVCGQAEDGPSALALVRELKPDLVIMDLSIKQPHGPDLLTTLTQQVLKPVVLVLSLNDSMRSVESALAAGATGYITKEEATVNLLLAIRRVLAGDVYVSQRMADRLLEKKAGRGVDELGSPLEVLTEREWDVFRCVGLGLATRQIAQELRLGARAVESHLSQIREKLHLSDAEGLGNCAIHWERQRQKWRDGIVGGTGLAASTGEAPGMNKPTGANLLAAKASRTEFKPARRVTTLLILGCALLVGGTARTQASDRTWTGAATGDYGWTNALNWGGTAPVDNDTLFFAGINGLTNVNNFPLPVSCDGLTFNSGAGTFKLDGNPIILNGGITNNGSRLQTIDFDVQIGTLAVCAANNGSIVLNGGVLSDTGALLKTGNAALALNGANTYPGGTTIRQGTILLRNDDCLGAGGGGLVLDGGSLEVSDSVVLNNRSITLGPGGGRFKIDPLGTLTITNDISGPGGLAKVGPGTLRLDGSVGSTGAVGVNGGTMLVDGMLAGPSSVVVNSGGVLGGNGIIEGDVLIADGGTLSPGISGSGEPATLTLGNLVINPNSIVRLELDVPGMLGASNDLIVVRGDLTLDGILKVTGHGSAGIYPIIKYDGVLTDNGMQLGSSVTGTLMIDTTNRIVSVNAQSFPAVPPTPMRVLFIGNSLTYTYDIPGTIQRLANAAGDWFTYGSDLEGGTSLSYHVSDGIAVPLIDSGSYDLVMLQEYSSWPTVPSIRDNIMYPAARTLNSHILAQGERTMFYETWGYPYGDPGDCSQYDIPLQYRGCDCTSMIIAVRKGYAGIANELKAAISPVGLAWLTSQAQRPDINLYLNATGEYHPGPAGSYLAACVHYASIFGRSPVGNASTGFLTDPQVASYLQSVAEQTVFRDPWGYDPFGFAPNRYSWACDWASYTNKAYSRLNGVVISGNGGLPSPSVKLDTPAGQTNNVYLGVYGYNYESAGQGRLYLRPGGSLEATGVMVVGKEGQGWVQHDGGSLQVDALLALGEQPSGGGSYALTDGSLVAAELAVGEAGQGTFQQYGGTIQIIGGLTLAREQSGSGSYSLNGGSLSASKIARGQGAATFNAAGGQLSFAQFGSAESYFDLTQTGGVLALSNTATLFGNYTLGPTGTLSLIIGNDSGSLFGVAGAAALAGDLVLTYAPGFAPWVGQQFLLLTATNITGSFSQVLKPVVLADGLMLVVNYTSNAIVGTVSSPAPPGLVGWWPGEGSAADIAGTNEGTLMGGATANAPGMVGTAFAFDGTNGFVEVPDSPDLRPPNLCIEGWVQFASLDSPGSGGSPDGDQYLLFKHNSQGGSFGGYELTKTRVAEGDVFRFRIASDSDLTAQVDSVTLVTTGLWYHVAAVRDSNYMQLYVNGQLENQTDIGFAQDYDTSPLYFGSSGQSSWDHKLDGILDEVSLYNRALSGSEIALIYAAGPGGKCRAPAVTVQPRNQIAPAGFSAEFAATALGPVLGYQWFYNHTNMLVGATNRVLSLTHLNLSQSGDYSVRATNVIGAVLSDSVSLEVTPVLGIIMPIPLSGEPGSVWRIDYVNDLGPGNVWTTLDTVILSNTSQVFLDNSALRQPQRFYRVVPLP